jgi:hypothetical protein
VGVLLKFSIRNSSSDEKPRIDQRIQSARVDVKELDGARSKVLDFLDGDVVRKGVGREAALVDAHKVHDCCVPG